MTSRALRLIGHDTGTGTSSSSRQATSAASAAGQDQSTGVLALIAQVLHAVETTAADHKAELQAQKVALAQVCHIPC